MQHNQNHNLGMDWKGNGGGMEKLRGRKFLCYTQEMERKWNGKINYKSSGDNFDILEWKWN